MAQIKGQIEFIKKRLTLLIETKKRLLSEMYSGNDTKNRENGCNDSNDVKDYYNSMLKLLEIDKCINNTKKELDASSSTSTCDFMRQINVDSAIVKLKKRQKNPNNRLMVEQSAGPQDFNDLFTKGESSSQGKDLCTNCGAINNIELIDGIRVCRSCGFSDPMIMEKQKQQRHDSAVPRTCTFSYKKLNHFNEWISQIQGKEVTKIPKDLFERVLTEMKKERIAPQKLTQKKVREYLKKLKLCKFYEHIPYITAQLGGEKPPSIPTEIEERIRKMFIDVSAPFVQYCPTHRRNFPRYTYIIYKCCELIGFKKILSYLPLLKTRIRLIEMDQIWKKICALLHYKFISTIG